jgi:ParB family chromosome partitioning protein
MEFTHDQGVNVRLSNIQPGRNPRRYFDPKEMADLEASIRAQGVLMPILLRPVDAQNGHFQIVAGERRFRAAHAVYGPDGEIPARIKTMTDEEADAAALAENIERADMTPVEEAEAAARVLGNCQGNRDEAAKRLGWSRGTLDKRLSLMYATEKVREALQNGKIMLGHAELLAVCRKESQDSTIELLLNQEKVMTVAELKAHIDRAALDLEKAIFNKDECTACVHNSGNQSALFTEAISGGRCTNKACYEGKTEAELDARAVSLRDEFQVVRIVRPGENLTLKMLVAEGDKGVGVEQAQACRVCKNFGAVVSAVPDKLGITYKNVCMDVPCNTQMVAKRAAAEAAAKAAQQPAQKPGQPNGSSGAAQTPSTDPKAQPTKAAQKGKGAAGAEPTYPEPSNRVKEYREKLWRLIFKRVVLKLSVEDNRMVLLALCLTAPGKIDRNALAKDLEAVCTVSATDGASSALLKLRDLEKPQLSAALQCIAANVSDGAMGLEIEQVVGMLKTFDVKVADHWKVSADFFSLLTKNEIDAVCSEIGVTQAMGGDYAKARNQGKDDYIKAILAIKDFDYRGRIPKLVTW